MKEILALAHKDLRILLRDRAGFFFTIFWPLIIAVFFGTIFGGGGGGGGGGGQSAVPVLIVDEDSTEYSQAFIDTLSSAPELDIRVTTREEAVEDVRRGRVVAFAVLTPGFGEASERMFWGEPPTIELGVDPARRADAAMVEGILMKYASERLQTFFSDSDAQRQNLESARQSVEASEDIPPGYRANLERFLGELDHFLTYESGDEQADTTVAGSQGGGFQPLAVERLDVARIRRRGPGSAYAISFPQGVIWGVIGVAAGFGISIVIERTRGTLLRLQISPLSRTQILAGKAVACFASSTGMAVGLFVIARLVFGLVPGSVPLLAFAIVSSSIGFVGIMMLLSVLGRTEQSAGGIGWAVLIVMSMLGGGMIPLLAMPAWMRSISHISPVKWSILAMEGAVWRGFSVVEMVQPCGILLAVGVVCFSIGVRAFSWTIQPE
jgi:ABC-2 type transport system permease protein